MNDKSLKLKDGSPASAMLLERGEEVIGFGVAISVLQMMKEGIITKEIGDLIADRIALNIAKLVRREDIEGVVEFAPRNAEAPTQNPSEPTTNEVLI